MSTDTEPRPGTTASIDRRVEALEVSVAGLVKDLALVQLEGTHTKELMKAGFDQLNAGQSATQMKLDLLLTQQAQAATAASDPEATAAGRLLLKEIAEAAAKADIAKAAADGLALKVAAASGAMAVLIVLINLLAPLARGLLGLP